MPQRHERRRTFHTRKPPPAPRPTPDRHGGPLVTGTRAHPPTEQRLSPSAICTQLGGEQQKLLQAHYAGAIPLDLLKKEQDRITASLETIEHRITAHHGHYADARANLDDSLKLLSNAADIYEHADDANRRLLNQALFKTIYIDEDNDVRVGYRNPYDGLSIPGLHADALTWAAEAKKMGQADLATKGGPLVASSHLTRLG